MECPCVCVLVVCAASMVTVWAVRTYSGLRIIINSVVVFVLDAFFILSKMTVSGKISGQNLASNLSGSI